MPRTDWYVGELMLKMINRQTGEISKVSYSPQKPAFPDLTGQEMKLERKTPESQGISSNQLRTFLEALDTTNGCDMHRVMVLRNGYVIGETAFAPYQMDIWHVTHSMCKSITGMAIGILIDEGKLHITDKIIDIFSSRKSIWSILRQKDLTVWNLLTMTSGVQFNESGAISGNDWRKSFLEASVSFAPGTKFEYNSMNSYMLSAIVTEITGESMFDYLKPRLFEPLGITRIFWESCPQKITKGGWGLFMRIEDMAKLGQLFLQKGNWNGQQLISEKWVTESTSSQIETGIENAEHYGYQLWINAERAGAFAFNGMLGQNVYCYPDINMVVATNAGNGEVFQYGTMTGIIQGFMHSLTVSGSALSEDMSALTMLKASCKHIAGRIPALAMITDGGWNRRPIPVTQGTSRRKSLVGHRLIRDNEKNQIYTSYRRIGNQFRRIWTDCLDGAVYDLDVKGVGLFPLMVQVLHNNFTDGISKIGFRKSGNNLFYMDLYEGSDIISLQGAFNGSSTVTDINMHGEIYRIAVKTIGTTDEYGRFVLRNQICFLEEAACRTLNIYFNINRMQEDIPAIAFLHPQTPDTIEVRMDETPGSEMIMSSLRAVAIDGSLEKILLNRMAALGAIDVFDQTVRATIRPVIHGQIIKTDSETELSESDEV